VDTELLRASIDRGVVTRDAIEEVDDDTDDGRRRSLGNGSVPCTIVGRFEVPGTAPGQSGEGGVLGVAGPQEVDAEESESEREDGGMG
jgi:hypothetical protein